MDHKKRLVELAEGVYVENDVLNIVEKVQNYSTRSDGSPRYNIKFVDPNRADFRDAPYAVFEMCNDGMERIAFTVWKLDDTVLEKLYLSDVTKHDVFAELEKANAAAKKEMQRQHKDQAEADKDLVAHVFASPKGRYSFKLDDGSRITIDDDPQRRYKKEPPK